MKCIEANVEYDPETDVSCIDLDTKTDRDLNTKTVSAIPNQVYLNIHKKTGRLIGIEIANAKTRLPNIFWEFDKNIDNNNTHIKAPVDNK